MKTSNHCGVVANLLDCNIVIREFKLQLPYNILFRINNILKWMNPQLFLLFVKSNHQDYSTRYALALNNPK